MLCLEDISGCLWNISIIIEEHFLSGENLQILKASTFRHQARAPSYRSAAVLGSPARQGLQNTDSAPAVFIPGKISRDVFIFPSWSAEGFCIFIPHALEGLETG